MGPVLLLVRNAGQLPMSRPTLVALLLCLPVIASAYCVEPNDRPPRCTEQFLDDAFVDDFEFSMCKREVERYVQQLEEWVTCVQTEAQERANKASRMFNCKAKGERFCR